MPARTAARLATWSAVATLVVSPAAPQAPGASLRDLWARRLEAYEEAPWADEYVARLTELQLQHLRNERGPADAIPANRGLLRVRDGWVAKYSPKVFQILNPELRIGPDEKTFIPAKVELVVETLTDLDRQLESCGVHLVAVPIPMRLHVYPELLVDRSDGDRCSGYAPGLTRLQLELLEAGVDVVDLLDPLVRAGGDEGTRAPDARQVFSRFDPHWSPTGVRAAAEAIAEHLSALPSIASLCPPERTSRLVALETADVEVHRKLPPEVEPPVLSLRAVVGPDGELVPFTDRESPVLLLGDSFAAQYQEQGADLGRHLQHHLGFALDNISIRGGSGHAARKALALRADPLAGKEALVWVFSIQTLRRGPTWKSVAIASD